jgi:hypothetical protein
VSVPVFDSQQSRGLPWSQRYASVRGPFEGEGIWVQQALGSSSPTEELAERRRQLPPPPRPCLFVSHRQADRNEALRAAWVADQEGFDYWLDILDTNLIAATAAVSPPVAIAGIIEMALLNSTHLLALMTPQTKGSEWVPYEYGRVKEPVPVCPKAGCWIAPALTGPTPEWLELGTKTWSESHIRGWLKRERAAWPAVTAPAGNWSGPPPAAVL